MISHVEYIVKHADEETKAKLRKGDSSMSINRVYKQLRAEKEPPKSKAVKPASIRKKKSTKQQVAIPQMPEISEKPSIISSETKDQGEPMVMMAGQPVDLTSKTRKLLKQLVSCKELSGLRQCSLLLQCGFKLLGQQWQKPFIGRFLYFLQKRGFDKATITSLLDINKEEIVETENRVLRAEQRSGSA
jgi:hypothetical protein